MFSMGNIYLGCTLWNFVTNEAKYFGWLLMGSVNVNESLYVSMFLTHSRKKG